MKSGLELLDELSTWCMRNRDFLSANYEVEKLGRYDGGKPHFFVRESELQKWIHSERTALKIRLRMKKFSTGTFGGNLLYMLLGMAAGFLNAFATTGTPFEKLLSGLLTIIIMYAAYPIFKDGAADLRRAENG